MNEKSFFQDLNVINMELAKIVSITTKLNIVYMISVKDKRIFHF